jgi:hypothetical protein
VGRFEDAWQANQPTDDDDVDIDDVDDDNNDDDDVTTTTNGSLLIAAFSRTKGRMRRPGKLPTLAPLMVRKGVGYPLK